MRRYREALLHATGVPHQVYRLWHYRNSLEWVLVSLSPAKCSDITSVEDDIWNDMVAKNFLEGLGPEWRKEEAAQLGWQTFERQIGGCKKSNSRSLITRDVLLLPSPGEPMVQSNLLKGRREDKEVISKVELVYDRWRWKQRS